MTDPSPAALPGSLFERLGDNAVLPTAFARGPWDPGTLHGGPVAGLLAHAVEEVAADGVEWFFARLTIDLERPVPMAPLAYETTVTRSGRKVSIVDATLTQPGSSTVLARARALRIRRADVPLPIADGHLAPYLAIEPPPPGPEYGRVRVIGAGDDTPAFHNGGTEHRFVEGSELGIGPVVDWVRLAVPLLPDSTLTPLQRVAAAVDFANGISHVLPWETYLFLNPDLTVHLFRPLRGEWVGMASATHHDAHGVGMSDTAVFDVDGRIGRSSQSLLFERR